MNEIETASTHKGKMMRKVAKAAIRMMKIMGLIAALTILVGISLLAFIGIGGGLYTIQTVNDGGLNQFDTLGGRHVEMIDDLTAQRIDAVLDWMDTVRIDNRPVVVPPVGVNSFITGGYTLTIDLAQAADWVRGASIIFIVVSGILYLMGMTKLQRTTRLLFLTLFMG